MDIKAVGTKTAETEPSSEPDSAWSDLRKAALTSNTSYRDLSFWVLFRSLDKGIAWGHIKLADR